jgi:hypothetical protein
MVSEMVLNAAREVRSRLGQVRRGKMPWKEDTRSCLATTTKWGPTKEKAGPEPAMAVYKNPFRPCRTASEIAKYRS